VYGTDNLHVYTEYTGISILLIETDEDVPIRTSKAAEVLAYN
jgi:hypothetical protein